MDWLLLGLSSPLLLLVAALGAEAYGLMFFLAAPTPEEAVGPLALFVLPPAALGCASGLWLGRWGALATLLPIPIVYVGGGLSANEPPPFEQYVFLVARHGRPHRHWLGDWLGHREPPGAS